jgi:hypothetical protein
LPWISLPVKRMSEALARCGWYNVPEAAQVAYMAYLGTVLSGYFFAGVREATLGGVGPAQSLQDLRAVGSQSAKAMTLPRWKRRLSAFFGRFRSAWRTLTKGN